MSINSYQFTRLSKTIELIRYIGKINRRGSVAVFDLEDCYSIPFRRLESNKLRAKARKGIHTFLTGDIELTGITIGIRINSIDDQNFKKDINLLNTINGKINWDCIFLPKTETRAQILKCIRILKKNKIKFGEVIPIVESRKGIKNLEIILASRTRKIFSRVAFGHCDYYLDCGIFPFPHHNSPSFWDKTKKIIKIIEKRGYTFVNSPVLELTNTRLFNKTLSKLKKTCKKEFSQVTLNLHQSQLCRDFKKAFRVKFPEQKEFNPRQILSAYLSNIISGRSFVVTRREKKIISPQEYIAAVNYLKIKF